MKRYDSSGVISCVLSCFVFASCSQDILPGADEPAQPWDGLERGEVRSPVEAMEEMSGAGDEDMSTVSEPDVGSAADQSPDEVRASFRFAVQLERADSIALVTGSGTFDYDVDWDGDDIFEEQGVTGPLERSGFEAGRHVIQIRGRFPHVRLGQAVRASQGCKIEVLQWGDIAWGSMEEMFSGCTNLRLSAEDTPDLSGVRSMHGMFVESQFDEPLNDWDVSHVEDMSKMFVNASRFDQDLDRWDVSGVVTMSKMFAGAASFNGEIGTWDVSSVLDMSHMFRHASSFNREIGTWDVSSVGSFLGMFEDASTFDRHIEAWDTSRAETMSSMFAGAVSFNQPLQGWDLSRVTHTENMFAGAIVFDQPIEAWDVSNLRGAQGMFDGASSFNQDLGGWETSSLSFAPRMFRQARSFDQDVSSWRFETIVDMREAWSGSGLSVERYDRLLRRWASRIDRIDALEVGVAGLRYCDRASRARLVQAGWTFRGDERAPAEECEARQNGVE